MDKKQFLGVNLLSDLKFIDTFRNTVHLLTGVQTDINSSIYCGGIYSHGVYMSWENCTPILHHISDLYKSITHNGETFIPIVELARLAYSKLNWNCGIEEDINGIKCFLYSKSGKKEYRFLYCESEQSFSTVSIPQNETKYVPYQLQLFQKLISWHFNLMYESEPFIDVNSLPENPYK